MKMRLTSLTILAVLMSVLVLAPLGPAAEAQTFEVKNELKNIPVEGTTLTPPGGAFEGKLTILGFTAAGGVLESVTGVLDGTVTNSTGRVTRVEKQTFTAPVMSFVVPSTSTAPVTPLQVGVVCDILFLDIGPISLDLLGLTIDLSRIILDVNAVPGEGNLLGNLLCAIVNLLNP